MSTNRPHCPLGALRKVQRPTSRHSKDPLQYRRAHKTSLWWYRHTHHTPAYNFYVSLSPPSPTYIQMYQLDSISVTSAMTRRHTKPHQHARNEFICSHRPLFLSLWPRWVPSQSSISRLERSAMVKPSFIPKVVGLLQFYSILIMHSLLQHFLPLG